MVRQLQKNTCLPSHESYLSQAAGYPLLPHPALIKETSFTEKRKKKKKAHWALYTICIPRDKAESIQREQQAEMTKGNKEEACSQ